MRNLTALLFVLSLCSLHLVFSAPFAFEYKTRCCSTITTMRIPLKNIVSYRSTSSSCPMKAIVFTTIKGKQICADPSAPWVKKAISTPKP
ncbi:monocyte chemotactic protein 1B-like [Silurus meridionalis]|uniref:monocyte chemotactic protein 1B-like n=1 Tax=Silurus meridionalis TaxID=175797 RepID=UPI001EEB23CC|nr:monocyte chemotactic protein 1B-like [Silurus meridionalis]